MNVDASQPDVSAIHARDRLSAIVDSCDDAIVSKDLNGIVTSWNRAAERMFGYTASEIVGRSIRVIIPENRMSEEDEVLARIRRGDAVRHFETLRLHKDGSFVRISLTVSPIVDADGRVVGASKIARDIGEQHRMRVALEEAAARQRDLRGRLSLILAASNTLLGSPSVPAVLENTLRLARDLIRADAGAIWRLDRHANAWRAVEVSGLSRGFGDRLVRAENGGAVHPLTFAEPLAIDTVDELALVASQREAYAEEGIRSMLVSPLKVSGDVTGTLVWYYREARTFSEVEKHAAGALGNLVAAALTNAELYARQEWLAERSRFLAAASALFTSSLDPAATLRTVARLAVPQFADWCVIHVVNDAGGVDRVATVHADPAKVKDAERLRAFDANDPHAAGGPHEVIRTGASVLVSDIATDRLAAGPRDETRREAARALGLHAYVCVPLRAAGQIMGALEFFRAESSATYGVEDVAFAEDLAFRVALAVDNARAYQRVMDADRAKDRFLAALSHELRTPLNAILGWARMLQRENAIDILPRALEVIDANVRLQTRMVDDLLDVSRIAAGKLQIELAPTDIVAVVRRAIDAAEPIARAKGVQLVVAAAEVAPVAADAARVQQAVGNLIANAVKFTPSGGLVKVDVEHAAGAVEIVIADTGIGIARETLPGIFDAFRQGDHQQRRHGLGLGLAIVREIVQRHGGTIRAESDGLGCGATFRMRLPLSPSTARPVLPV